MPLEKLPPFPADTAHGAGVAAYLLVRGLMGALRERGVLTDSDITAAVLAAEQSLEGMAMVREPTDPFISNALGLIQSILE
jgi:hypothetical protein